MRGHEGAGRACGPYRAHQFLAGLTCLRGSAAVPGSGSGSCQLLEVSESCFGRPRNLSFSKHGRALGAPPHSTGVLQTSPRHLNSDPAPVNWGARETFPRVSSPLLPGSLSHLLLMPLIILSSFPDREMAAQLPQISFKVRSKTVESR